MYDAKGELIGDIKPQGDVPQLEAGNNVVQFSCNVPEGVSARANVTIISQDDTICRRIARMKAGLHWPNELQSRDMTRRLINTSFAASLLIFTADVAVHPARAQTDTERQDIMMVMEGAGTKKPSSMSVKDKADLMLRRLTRAGQKLLVYSTPAITNDPILPWADIPAKPSDVMAMRACRGEYEPASFVAYPIEGDLTIEVTATDLKGSAGTIASASVDIRVVKCWYQAGRWRRLLPAAEVRRRGG